MGTGVGEALLIGSLVVAAVGTAVAVQSQRGQAQFAATQAVESAVRARETAALQDAELLRQQQEINRIAAEDKGDAVRKAEYALGTVFANAGEFGASSGSVARLVAEIGAYEGLDLARIEANRKSDVLSKQAAKEVAKQGAVNTITQSAFNVASAKASSRNAITSGVLGFAGTSLSLGSKYTQQRRTEARLNRTA